MNDIVYLIDVTPCFGYLNVREKETLVLRLQCCACSLPGCWSVADGAEHLRGQRCPSCEASS